jgi:hypothetical protein
MKMTEDDMYCPELRTAWKGYHAAIAMITDKQEQGIFTQTGWQSLIDSHLSKIECLERAQRILNAFNSFERY